MRMSIIFCLHSEDIASMLGCLSELVHIKIKTGDKGPPDVKIVCFWQSINHATGFSNNVRLFVSGWAAGEVLFQPCPFMLAHARKIYVAIIRKKGCWAAGEGLLLQPCTSMLACTHKNYVAVMKKGVVKKTKKVCCMRLLWSQGGHLMAVLSLLQLPSK